MKNFAWFLKRIIPLSLAIVGIFTRSTYWLCIAIFGLAWNIWEDIDSEGDH